MNPLFPFNGTRHLGEADLLEPLAGCPLCGEEKPTVEFRLQQRPEVSLRSCRRCGGASVSRMPTEAALARLYATFYPEGDEVHVTFGNIDRFGEHLHRYFAHLRVRESLRILDFGGGDGSIALSLATQLRRAGVGAVRIMVVERIGSLAVPDDDAIAIGRIDGLDGCAPAAFDIVLASGVVEHVTEPIPLLRSLLSKLSDGGLFYARTPHVLPYMRLMRRGAVARFFPFPAHLHDMGQRFWEFAFAALLEGGGCGLIESRPAIVQVSFRQHWQVALASHVMKAPWRILGRAYPYVGGWEIVAEKRPAR